MKLKPNLVQYVIFSSAIKSAENIDKCYVIYGSYMITLWLFYDVWVTGSRVDDDVSALTQLRKRRDLVGI